MTRPRRHLALIALFLVVALAAGLRLPDAALWAMAGAGAALIAVCAVAGRQLFRARALMQRGRWDEAALALVAFELEQTRSAWRRGLAPLFVGTFSSRGVAVARSTLGAVRLEQGRLDEARRHLEQALEHDPGYAVPHANLALLAARQGRRADAEAHRARAHALGFRRASLQRALDAALAAAPDAPRASPPPPAGNTAGG